MKTSKILSIFFGYALFFTSSLPFSSNLHAEESQGSIVKTPRSKLFNITINGTVSGWPFSRTGILMLAPTFDSNGTNDVNPVEVVIVSGEPLGTRPERGAIQFATNDFFLEGSTHFDLALVSVSGNCVSIQPDPEYRMMTPNVFNVNSGITAIPYMIYSGNINGCVDRRARTVSGHINVEGSPYYYGNSASYVADFEGQFAGTVDYDNLISTNEINQFQNIIVSLKMDESINDKHKSIYRREIRKLQTAVLEKLNNNDVLTIKRFKYTPTMLMKVTEHALQELVTFPEVDDITNISSAFRVPN